MIAQRSFRRILAASVVAAMSCASLITVPNVAQAEETSSSGKKDVQVIAFQQTWNTIAKECANTYGPEGVAYVEVSPPQESIQGTQWWTSYQPVSYKLDSKLGTEAEFKNMVQQCATAGVGIIADVVLNQTTGSDVADGDQKGVAGSEYNGSTGSYPGFATKQYPEGITASDFHSCKKNISDYTNQKEVQECRLSSMWDFQFRKRRRSRTSSPIISPRCGTPACADRVVKHCSPAHKGVWFHIRSASANSCCAARRSPRSVR